MQFQFLLETTTPALYLRVDLLSAGDLILIFNSGMGLIWDITPVKINQTMFLVFQQQ